MKLSKTREELVKMYIDCLKENEIPFKKRWASGANINGITNREYKGVNQLILNYVAYVNKYNDNRWYTYNQIKENGYKLKNAKSKGVPIEFLSVYNTETKQKISFSEYEEYIEKNPEDKEKFKIINRGTFVFNGSLIEGLPERKPYIDYFDINVRNAKYIFKLMNELDVDYAEYGDKAFYSPVEDKIVLPKIDLFRDVYTYQATLLHELCHSTGHEKRLNRNLLTNDKKEYAREELIAEISSSFLMQKLDVDICADHYDNHKSYIQSWISILEDKPQELFKAINESDKVCKYIDDLMKVKNREVER